MSRARSIALVLATMAGCSTPPPPPAKSASADVPRPAAVSGTSPVAPLANVVRSSTPWDEGGGPGERVRTNHYNLHLAVKDPVFRGQLPAYMEACLAAYASALAPLPLPGDPMDFYIFASRQPWERWTRRTLGEDAEIYLGLGRGGFTTDGTSVLYDLGRVDTLTIAAHEGWHQFSQRTLRTPLPTWMEEGLSCWMEGTRLTREGTPSAFRPWRNFERWNELRTAVREDRLIPLGELLESSPQQCLERGTDDLLTYYAQTWALVHFLHEGAQGRYRDALRQLIGDAASGALAGRLAASTAIPDPAARRRASRSRLGRLVILEYFDRDFEAFSAAYEAFLVDITRRGAGDRIYRGENPLTAPAAAAPGTPPPK
jgi:hypothetical protein